MDTAGDTRTLRIGMNSWIISDGNYADFKVDEMRSFALEYYNADDLRNLPKSRDRRSFTPLERCRYAVRGRTIHLTKEWAAIDIGVLAYRELYAFPPPPKRFEGEIWLGIDPFFYFEKRARETDAPALIYDWHIHRIEQEFGPRILKDGAWVRDPARLQMKDVEDTREGEDFVLHCELLPKPPRRTLAPG